MSVQLQTHAHETTGRAIVHASILVSVAIGILALLLIGVSALLAAAFGLGLDFLLWSSVVYLGGSGLLVAALLLMGWENARWVLVETIAANVEKGRAEAKRIEAEAVRIEAEADAISGANTAIIQNVNAAEGSKVKASLNAPRVSVRGKSVSWNQLNQLNQSAPEVRRIEIPALDVIWFAEQLANGYPHSKRSWLGQKFPNSRLTVDYLIYTALVEPLAEQGHIVGRGDRSAGKLVETNPTNLVKAIDPQGKGLVLELPAESGLESGLASGN